MSNLKFAASIQSLQDGLDFLGKSSAKKLCYETHVTKNQAGVVQVQHHGSTIATFYADGSITYSNAGYHSSTTRNRIHRLTPDGYYVGQEKGAQIVSTYEDGKRVKNEYDRTFTITTDGQIITDMQA